MPSNMPDARAVEEALRRAREMQGARRITRRPRRKSQRRNRRREMRKRQLKYRRNFRLLRIDLFLLSIRC